MKFRFLLALSVMATLTAPPGAKAAPPPPFHQETPQSVQGVWAWPACSPDKASTILVLSRFFRLSLEQNLFLYPDHPTQNVRVSRIKAWRSEAVDGAPLHYYRLSNRESYVLKMPDDRSIKSIYRLVPPQQPVSEAWGPKDDITAMQFQHCDATPDTALPLTNDELALPFLMDKMVDACGKTASSDFPEATACHSALFTTADGNNDRLLDGAELALLYRQVGFLSSLANTCGAFKPPYPGPIPREAEEFKTQAIARLDRDRNGSLSEEETLSAFSNPFFLQGRLYQFVERVRGLRIMMLPFMPLADSEKICTNYKIIEEEEWTGDTTPPPGPDDPLGIGLGTCSSCAAAAKTSTELKTGPTEETRQ